MVLRGQRGPAAGPSVQTVLRKAVIRPLLGSENPSDRRKGRDLLQLAALENGAWSERMALLGARPGYRRTLDVLVAIRAAGLIFGSSIEDRDTFQMVLGIPNNYPMAGPLVTFVNDPAPYHPNVLHRDFLPDTRGLPAELQQLVNDERGGACCYSMASEWTPDLDHSLATVVRHVSRLLVGAKLRGEEYALNTHARDYYLKLKQQGRLPLGPALPLPGVSGDPAALLGAADSAEDADADEAVDDAVEWIEES